MAEEVIIDINIDRDEGDYKKLADLKGTLVGLKQEQKALTEALKAGAITQKEYNSEIVRVETLQKKVQAEYNKTQRSITGLKNPLTEINDSLKKQNTAIKNVVPALDQMTGGAISAAGAIFGMVKASLAFLVTPLGLAIAAVTAALAPFAAFLTQSGEGADMLTREMAGFRSVLQLVRDDLVRTGKEQKSFFTSIVEGIKASNPALGALINSYNALAESGRKYADVLDDVQDAQENFSIQASKDENEIKRLLLQAKNRTTEEEKRIELLNQALTIEANLVNKRIGFAQEELSGTVERNRARLESIGIIQKENETQEDFIANNIDRIRDFDEALAKSLIDQVKKLEEARSSGIAIEEKAQNQIDAIRDKAEQRQQKRDADALKAAQDARKQRIEDFDSRLEQDALEFEKEVEKQEQNVEFQKGILDKLAKDYETFKKRITDADKKAADRSKKVNEEAQKDKEALQQQALGTAMTFFGRSQKASSAITLIDTYLGAQKAYNSQLIPGDPSSLIRATLAAILAAAQGLGRVALINGVKFASGGILSGPSHERGGIPFTVGRRAGFEAEGGEAIINKRSTAMFRRELSAINEAGGGVKFAVGGIVDNETRLATQNASAQFDINQMAGLLNQVQTILVLEDFEAKQNSVNNNQRRATVIG